MLAQRDPSKFRAVQRRSRPVRVTLVRYRKLGDSELEVSEISLGSWLTFGEGVEREQTEACTRAAFDVGITLFDTSNAYGRGTAEQVWGEIL